MAEWGKVDKMRETRKLLEHGDLKTYFRVWATTAKGVPFTLEVAEEDMKKEKLDELLRGKAAELDAIMEL